MSLERVILTVTSGVFVGLLGVAIRYFGRVELIAGYDPERVVDDDALAKFVGTNTLYVAALTILVGVVDYVEPFGGQDAHWLVFVFVVFALTGRMIVGSRRYERPRDDAR
ncbi:DUF3784 domain-containing protein [Natribaculum luteum]|uniref:DUF3784 domain-containing protein n=1 Tax=Natribaculum luteum TaxID=1586232 RepID=A0ABD5NYU7_9EURY|nr:DUF3784 domain-containing protein [Natribaculum luteum]